MMEMPDLPWGPVSVSNGTGYSLGLNSSFCEVGMASSVPADDCGRFAWGSALESVTEKCPKARTGRL